MNEVKRPEGFDTLFASNSRELYDDRYFGHFLPMRFI
jgi:hypothetical protein